MTVFICPTPNEMGKFHGVMKAFPEIWQDTILDVGCRSRHLQKVLSENGRKVRYQGLDLCPPADILANLENRLPFIDAAFDVVVALDVLEHINDIHGAFAELCRISKKYVVIALPNAYEFKMRLSFLLGRPISGKYGLPANPSQDRHRWIFSLKEAQSFTNSMAQKLGFETRREGYLVGPRRKSFIAKFMIEMLPNLFSPWYLALLRRRGTD